MTGYTRNDTSNNIADGNIINASDLDGEFDAIQTAFDVSTGHSHDGTVGEGAPIEVVGPTQDVVITASVIRPKTDNTVDLGTSTLEFKDLFIDGTAKVDTLTVDENASVTGTLNVTGTTTLGTLNVTTIDTTNIEVTTLKAKDGTSAGSIADSTGVVTLASSVLTTTDINGGTVDGAVIGGSSAAAITGTTITATGDVTIPDKIIHAGDTNTAIRFPAADTVTVETNGVERMRITSAGLVGIGATSPVNDLDVNGSIGLSYSGGLRSYQTSGTTNSYYLRMVFSSGDNLEIAPVGNATTSTVIFKTASASVLSERMRITSTGNVGIGTSSPTAAKLVITAGDTAQTAQFQGATGRIRVRGYQDATNGGIIDSTNTAENAYAPLTLQASALRLLGNNATGITVDSSGNVGIGTSSPSQRLHVAGAVYASGDGSDVAFYMDGSDAIRNTSTGGIVYHDVAFGSATHGQFVFRSSNAATERMRIDASGNLGLGVTPSAWNSSRRALQIGQSTALYSFSTSQSILGTNVYMDTGGTDRYLNSAAATQYVQSGGAHSWNNAPSGTAGNAITFTQAMTLDASGNLGLGTTSPDARLRVIGNTSAGMFAFVGATTATGYGFFQNSSGTTYGYLGNGGGGAISAGTANDFVVRAESELIFGVGNNRHVTLNSSGDLLVGVTSAGTDRVRFASAGLSKNQLGLVSTDDTSGNGFVIFRRSDGTGIGSISRNGTTNAVLYNTTSDYRLKENVTDLVGGLSRVMALRPVSWVWKDCEGQTGEGFIAHEVQAIVPSAVSGEKDAVEDNGDIKPQGMDASYLVATLVKAIQELKAEVDSLRAQLTP
jgi:hypothetical protein